MIASGSQKILWEEVFAGAFNGFRSLAETPEKLDMVWDPWVKENIETLCEWESEWKGRMTGDTLIHTDIRADQILISDDKVYFLDWPHACLGASWLDYIFMMPSMAMQGAPPVAELIEMSPVKNVNVESVRTAFTVLCGFFVSRSIEPPQPGLPTLRKFQKEQAIEALRWLKTQV